MSFDICKQLNNSGQSGKDCLSFSFRELQKSNEMKENFY